VFSTRRRELEADAVAAAAAEEDAAGAGPMGAAAAGATQRRRRRRLLSACLAEATVAPLSALYVPLLGAPLAAVAGGAAWASRLDARQPWHAAAPLAVALDVLSTPWRLRAAAAAAAGDAVSAAEAACALSAPGRPMACAALQAPGATLTLAPPLASAGKGAPHRPALDLARGWVDLSGPTFVAAPHPPPPPPPLSESFSLRGVTRADGSPAPPDDVLQAAFEALPRQPVPRSSLCAWTAPLPLPLPFPRLFHAGGGDAALSAGVRTWADANCGTALAGRAAQLRRCAVAAGGRALLSGWAWGSAEVEAAADELLSAAARYGGGGDSSDEE
jgi:hypothetical protein